MPTQLLLEGPAIEPLLQRVWAEHGTAAKIVKAERVRIGGIVGFFAKEQFEVTIEVDVPGLSGAPGLPAAGAPALDPAPPAALPAAPSPTDPAGGRVGLEALMAAAELVERDVDHVPPALGAPVPAVPAATAAPLTPAAPAPVPAVTAAAPAPADPAPGAELPLAPVAQADPEPVAVEVPDVITLPDDAPPLGLHDPTAFESIFSSVAAEHAARWADGAIVLPETDVVGGPPVDAAQHHPAQHQPAQHDLDQPSWLPPWQPAAAEPAAGGGGFSAWSPAAADPGAVRELSPPLAAPLAAPVAAGAAAGAGVPGGTAFTTRAERRRAEAAGATAPEATAAPVRAPAGTPGLPAPRRELLPRARRVSGPDLRSLPERLASLGVPAGWLGDLPASRADALRAIAQRIEAAPAQSRRSPTALAPVAVVLADVDAALAVSRQLAAGLGLDVDEVVLAARAPAGVVHERCVPSRLDLVGEARAARESGRPLVVALPAPVGAPPLQRGLVAETLEAIAPDEVWAVVDATRRLDDTGAWVEALAGPRGVDAVALVHADVTSAPAAALALPCPVVLVDDRPATTDAWVELLAARLASQDLG